MEQEDPFEVKKASFEAKNPITNVQDSLPCFESDSSLSEEEIITESNRGIISLSPLCNQFNDKMKIDSLPLDCVLVSDEEIIESMHQSLLRIIVTLQIQSNDNVSAASEIWYFDCCKTPPSQHRDSKFVPDTCPGAPMKLNKISRNIDSGLRRKLF